MITRRIIVQNWTLGVGRWIFIAGAALLLIFPLNGAYAKSSENKQPPATKKQTPPKIQQQVWPKPFTPSEKISADQAVAFPVDI